DPPRGRRLLPDERPQQGGLPGAVGPEQPDPVARAEPPRHRVEQQPVTQPDRHVLDVVDVLAEPGGGVALQLDDVARRRLTGDQRVGGVYAELRLRRACGRAAAQPRELLAQQVAPSFLARSRLPLPLRTCQHVRRVAAVVTMYGGTGDLPGL